MKNKKQVLKKVNLILAALLVSCMILSALASCQNTGEYIQNDNELRSIQPNDTQTVSAVTSESETSTIDKNHVSQAAEEMASGKIYANLLNLNWDNQLKPLAKWFYTNILEKNEKDITDVYTVFREIAYYKEINLKYVSYELSNTEKTQYLSILLGVKNDTNQHFLIDGKLTDTDQYYPIKDSWDKVKKHAVFGEYVQDFPETIVTEGMKELDIASLIGKNRTIQLSLFADNNTIAVINTNQDRIPSDWKIDFIDMKTGSVINRRFKDINDLHLTVFSDPGESELDNGFLIIYFIKQKSVSEAGAVLKYKLKLNTESNAEDEITTYPLEEQNNLRYKKILTSESGRYYSFHKDYDLYLHDNKTGKDILVYDAYYSDNTEEWNKVHVATAAYFVGDTIYFDVLGSTYLIGNGSYNPATKKQNLYKNGISTVLANNGYIYGYQQDFLHRFNVKTPDNLELLTTETNVIPDYKFSPDMKYIVKIVNSEDYTGLTVTIYSSADFKEVKTYTLTSPFLKSKTCIITDDYIYLFMESNISDNTAYIMKLGA